MFLFYALVMGDVLAFKEEEKGPEEIFQKILREKFEDTVLLEPEDLKWINARYWQKTSKGSPPEFVLLMGMPGSGKTTFQKNHASRFHHFIIINQDEIIVHLSGYKRTYFTDPQHAIHTYSPLARKLALAIAYTALSLGRSAVYDGPLDLENLQSLLTYGEERGYKIFLNIFMISPWLAHQRIVERAKKEGRNLDIDIPYFLNKHSTHLQNILAHLDQFPKVVETRIFRK